MTIRLHLCLLVLAGVAGSLIWQTQGSDSSLIENSIKAKEPTWELSAKKVKRDSTSYRWQSGEQRISINIFVTESPEAAAEKLNKFAQYVPVPPKERLKSPGDEALLYQSANTNECMILFRRGKVFVHLNGSLVSNAKRFAKHLDDLFKDK